MERAVTQALSATLRGLDETILEYISGAVADQLADKVPADAAALEAQLEESVAPFLLSTGFCDDEAAASQQCAALAAKLMASPELQALRGEGGGAQDAVRVLENTQSIEEQARKDEARPTPSSSWRACGASTRSARPRTTSWRRSSRPCRPARCASRSSWSSSRPSARRSRPSSTASGRTRASCRT